MSGSCGTKKMSKTVEHTRCWNRKRLIPMECNARECEQSFLRSNTQLRRSINIYIWYARCINTRKRWFSRFCVIGTDASAFERCRHNWFRCAPATSNKNYALLRAHALCITRVSLLTRWNPMATPDLNGNFVVSDTHGKVENMIQSITEKHSAPSLTRNVFATREKAGIECPCWSNNFLVSCRRRESERISWPSPRTSAEWRYTELFHLAIARWQFNEKYHRICEASEVKAVEKYEEQGLCAPQCSHVLFHHLFLISCSAWYWRLFFAIFFLPLEAARRVARKRRTNNEIQRARSGIIATRMAMVNRWISNSSQIHFFHGA